jgi:hypothetical protein
MDFTKGKETIGINYNRLPLIKKLLTDEPELFKNENTYCWRKSLNQNDVNCFYRWTDCKNSIKKIEFN